MVFPQNPAIPGQAHCRLCGRPMDRNMAAMRNNVCQAPACEAQRTREAALQIQQRDWEQHKATNARRLAQAAPRIAVFAEAVEKPLDTFQIQMLPRQTRPMTGPDPEEREAFLEHLEEIIEKSFATDPEPTRAVGRAKHDAAEPAAVYASCSTCKGDCCNLGGPSKAFLNADVISEFRALHPDWDAEQILNSYVERLPDVTPLGSCQYHGVKGCTLQRDQRAQLCNSHHCRPLKYLLHLSGVIGDKPVALIALDEEGDGLDATLLQDGAWEAVETGDPEGLSQAETDQVIGHGMAWLPEVSPMIRPVHRPAAEAHVCRWCGQTIDVNLATTTQSCGAEACEAQRMTELARSYSDGR